MRTDPMKIHGTIEFSGKRVLRASKHRGHCFLRPRMHPKHVSTKGQNEKRVEERNKITSAFPRDIITYGNKPKPTVNLLDFVHSGEPECGVRRILRTAKKIPPVAERRPAQPAEILQTRQGNMAREAAIGPTASTDPR